MDAIAGYWAGNSTQGPIFMIINTADTTQTLGFNLTENCTGSNAPSHERFPLTNSIGAVRAGRQYKVRDLWLHQNIGTAVRSVHFGTIHIPQSELTMICRTWNVTLPSHGVAALLLTDDGPEPANETPPCAEPWLAIGNCANYG